MSQKEQVLKAITVGDLVYALPVGGTEGIYSVGCLTEYGPILIGAVLIVSAWSEMRILPPF